VAVGTAGDLDGVGAGDVAAGELGDGDGGIDADGLLEASGVPGAADVLAAGLGTGEDPAPHAAQMTETAAASTQSR
jgi:hypothetical protein